MHTHTVPARWLHPSQEGCGLAAEGTAGPHSWPAAGGPLSPLPVQEPLLEASCAFPVTAPGQAVPCLRGEPSACRPQVGC